MPAIRDQVLDCSFYLYPSLEDAKNGERSGGCGFFVGVPLQRHPECNYIYAVTAGHVIHDGATAIRLNKKDGNPDFLPTRPNDWVSTALDDVAVSLIELADPIHRFSFFPLADFATKEVVANRRITLGDDAVMVGRFISHEGRQRNHPTVRFGNISMMPVEPVHMGDNQYQEGYLVEIRSLPGYSGSAVFYHEPIQSSPPKSGQLMAKHWLLGVDAYHLQDSQYVRRFNEESREWEEDTTQCVHLNTGMAVVVPCWKIIDLLESPKLVAARMKDEEEYEKEQA